MKWKIWLCPVLEVILVTGFLFVPGVPAVIKGLVFGAGVAIGMQMLTGNLNYYIKKDV